MGAVGWYESRIFWSHRNRAVISFHFITNRDINDIVNLQIHSDLLYRHTKSSNSQYFALPSQKEKEDKTCLIAQSSEATGLVRSTDLWCHYHDFRQCCD